MTWEGYIRKKSSKSIKSIGLAKNEQAFIQSLALKRTLEMMKVEEKRGLIPGERAEEEVL